MRYFQFWGRAALLGYLFLLSPMIFGATSFSPPLNPHLKQAASNIPIPGFKAAVEVLYASLEKDPRNGGYFGMTTLSAPGYGSIPLQMYFFGDAFKQALIIVANKELRLPKVFNNKAWGHLDGATISDAIFSFSTADYALDVRTMPESFQRVVSSSYFSVTSLNFTSGFQVSGKIRLGSTMKQVIEKTMNIPLADFTLRAGVVVPAPTDATGSAALAAQLAADMENVEKTIKDVPDFFIEFQPKPGTVIPAPLGMGQLRLSDATISLSSQTVLGLRGNLMMTNDKKIITLFQTPLTPAGLIDLKDFQFGFAAQTLSLEDQVQLLIAMNTPMMPGGNPVKGLSKYSNQLLLATKPLSVFQMRNPSPIGEYRFGDITKPFPNKSFFNFLIMGPTASTTDSNGQSMTGPYFQALGDPYVLGQKLGSSRLTIGDSGLNGTFDSDVSLKFGPLGRTVFRMRNTVDVTASKFVFQLTGNALGRSLMVTIDNTKAKIYSPATCSTPFDLNASFDLNATLSLQSMFDQTPGVNVDPAMISGCVGEQLKAAYRWVASTGSMLGGYGAAQATAELKRIDDQARAAYNKAKDAARDLASRSSSGAMNAFNEAGNAFKRIGKKKHKKGPDPKFAASVFDWDFYYDNAADLRDAAATGAVDLALHWRLYGFNEGRQGSLLFSARWYLDHYPDLKNVCGSNLQCGLEHWLDHGIREGRQGSPNFWTTIYLARYPDLVRAFGQTNYEEALNHWITYGEDEGRSGRP